MKFKKDQWLVDIINDTSERGTRYSTRNVHRFSDSDQFNFPANSRIGTIQLYLLTLLPMLWFIFALRIFDSSLILSAKSSGTARHCYRELDQLKKWFFLSFTWDVTQTLHMHLDDLQYCIFLPTSITGMLYEITFVLAYAKSMLYLLIRSIICSHRDMTSREIFHLHLAHRHCFCTFFFSDNNTKIIIPRVIPYLRHHPGSKTLIEQCFLLRLE